jgi:hypothetical protein
MLKEGDEEPIVSLDSSCQQCVLVPGDDSAYSPCERHKWRYYHRHCAADAAVRRVVDYR